MGASARLSFAVTTLFLIAVGCSAEPARDTRPNILLLIGDDHGYPYFGFMGHEVVQTPNLDRLAASGTVFTQGQATSNVCRPSLWTFLTGFQPLQIREWALRRTGRHFKSGRPGITQWKKLENTYTEIIRDDPDTLPRALARAGYVTFQAGKYWEGSFENAGFTEGTSTGGPMKAFHLDSLVERRAGGDGLAVGRTTLEPVMEFISRHRDERFFVWYAPMLPHPPFDAPGRLRRPYLGRGLSTSTVAYYANCTWFDEGVGTLLDLLDELGLGADTLVVYASDNGWHQESDVVYLHNLAGPRGKLSVHEQGFRTPVIFAWPGRVPSRRTRDDLVSTADLYPTLLAYAGAAAPANRPGENLRPVIEERGSLDRDALIASTTFVRLSEDQMQGANPRWRRAEVFTLTTPEWHYVLDETRDTERLTARVDGAHDLAEDATDVAASHPKLTAEFRRRIESWKSDLRAAADPGDSSEENGGRAAR